MRLPDRPSGTLDVIAVGDISLGDSAQGIGGGVHARFERVLHSNVHYPFEHAASLFTGADIVFGNLETILSHRRMSRWNASSMEMRGHPEAAARLSLSGFTMLNVANNHMMQHGMHAFTDTVDALRHAGMGVVGVADSGVRSCVPQVAAANGLTVTLLGYAFERDKYARGEIGYAFGPDCDIPGQIADAKRESDIVICSVHWGVEFIRHPSIEEEQLGRQWIDAGADLVLGHHPHVTRRIERYRRGLIAYSLGNFVFDMLWNPALRTGLVLRVRLSRNGVDGYDTDFVWIDDDFQPRPLGGIERDRAAEDYAELDERPDWISDDEQYRRQYEQLVVRNRHESYRHFLRYMNRRPLVYTAQTLLRTARRKLVGASGPQ